VPVSVGDAAAVRDPARARRWLGVLAALVVLWPLVVLTEFQPWTLFDARSLRVTGRFLAQFVPPRHDAEFLALLVRETWRTVAIATAGMALASLIALPLSLALTERLSVSAVGGRMGRGPAVLRQALRAFTVVLRSVPELVWALVFVRVVGLGPTAGVLAIAIAYGGMLAKVWAEILDSADAAPAQALLGHGAGRLQTWLYAALPVCAPELASYTVYRWECAIRSSVVLGFVGAGGLGQQLDNAAKMFAGGEVGAILLVFMALVALSDRLSVWVRRGQRWLVAGLPCLVVASFAGLDLHWAEWLGPQALGRMGVFLGSFWPPEGAAPFLWNTAQATLETLAMSLLGTVLAALAGLLLAVPASRSGAARLVLNALRSVPELVWAALLLVSAGLGPLPGTLALALHTTGVLGRLLAQALENAPPGPAQVLRSRGVGAVAVFLYATLPQVSAQWLAYTLYRWENNIRAAAVLGVVGAGGLGQMLSFHLGLFQMRQACTVLLAMIGLVALVDALSAWVRRNHFA
jgi:phosphonate transport system permease protein